MSLFGRKRPEDESAAPAKPEASEVAPPPSASTEKKKGGYGIDQVVALMRRLPADNIELVVRVLKETLESVTIPLPGLIKEAEKRDADLTQGIADHKKAISTLEAELAAKKKQIEDDIAAKQKAIGQLEADQKEILLVKDRLNLGLKLGPIPGRAPEPRGPSTAAPPASEIKVRGESKAPTDAATLPAFRPVSTADLAAADAKPENKIS